MNPQQSELIQSKELGEASRVDHDLSIPGSSVLGAWGKRLGLWAT